MFSLIVASLIAASHAKVYKIAGKRANFHRPLNIDSNWTYNYNPTYGDAGFLLIRSQNNTDPKDPFAVGPSVLTFSRRETPFTFSPINDSNIIMRPVGPAESFGVEDPRLTYDSKTTTYYMLYSAVEDNGTAVISRLALATANESDVDQESGWVRHGPVFPQIGWSKSGAMLIRDAPPHYLFFGDSSLVDGLQWATSNDLLNWTLQPDMFMRMRPNAFDSGLIEAGPRPMRLSTGDYLLIYNSAQHGHPSPKKGYDFQYNVGYAILNGSDPSQILQRSSVPLFSPEYAYEIGLPPAKVCVPNVVFAEGIEELGPDQFRIYYGAADAVVAAFDIYVY